MDPDLTMVADSVELDTNSFLALTTDFNESLLKQGISFDSITLKTKLGAGGFGVVYRAFCDSLQKDVAVKLFDGAGHDEKSIKRFLKEAEALARFSHPNILKIYRCFSYAPQKYCLVSELIEGQDLKEFSPKKLSESQVISYLKQIAEALATIHEAGLIHRDIKPANIMVDKKGRAVLMDFGIVKNLNSDETTLTEIGTAVGTPSYMPPEQFDAKSELSSASDIYALGVAFYELLTGENPFRADTVPKVLAKKFQHEVKPLYRVDSTKSLKLSLLLEKMMARHVEDRPASGRVLLDELPSLSLGVAEETVKSKALAEQKVSSFSKAGTGVHRGGLDPEIWLDSPPQKMKIFLVLALFFFFFLAFVLWLIK